MTLRQRFLPLQPEFDRFLFATVGDEIEGMPLSVISARTRLGLDPWQEAGRLSSMTHHEAVEQLARLIAENPVDHGNGRMHAKLPEASSACCRRARAAAQHLKSKFAHISAD
jgi:hypothetical protein